MNWIGIDEKMPETTHHHQMVIVSTDRGVGVARYDRFNGFNNITLNGSTQYGNLSVAHWMPFPSAP